VSQFSHLKSFRESIGKKKVQDRFYKGEEGLNLRGSFDHKTSFNGSTSQQQKSTARQAQSVGRNRHAGHKGPAGPLHPATLNNILPNKSLNLKLVSDSDQVKMLNNSDRLATFDFMRQQ